MAAVAVGVTQLRQSHFPPLACFWDLHSRALALRVVVAAKPRG